MAAEVSAAVFVSKFISKTTGKQGNKTAKYICAILREKRKKRRKIKEKSPFARASAWLIPLRLIQYGETNRRT